MSSRNTELEEFYNKHGSVAEELQQTIAQNEALLTLLGEKSEELEACQQDLLDVKDLYRSQLDELLAFKLSHQSVDNVKVSVAVEGGGSGVNNENSSQ